MKKSALIPLALGLVVGIVAIKLTFNLMNNAKGNQGDMVPAIVARMDIGATMPLTAENLQLIETPKTPLLPAERAMSVEELIGRVAMKMIPAGAPILPTMLAPPGSMPGLVVAIPDGYRAYTVKIDEASGVAYRVNPNDFVDVIVVMQVKRGRESETISKIILQNVEVGAVGQSVDQDADGKVAKSVTLLVPAEEVPKLHLAQSRGQLSLAMRGMEDKLMAQSGLTNTDELIELEHKRAEPEPEPEADPEAAAQEAREARWTVLVVNGPTDRQDLGRSSRQTTFESTKSMKVMQGSGNGGGGAASPDSAEALMSPRQRRAAALERQRRGYRPSAGAVNRDDQSDADMTEDETEPVDDDWEDAG